MKRIIVIIRGTLFLGLLAALLVSCNAKANNGDPCACIANSCDCCDCEMQEKLKAYEANIENKVAYEATVDVWNEVVADGEMPFPEIACNVNPVSIFRACRQREFWALLNSLHNENIVFIGCKRKESELVFDENSGSEKMTVVMSDDDSQKSFTIHLLADGRVLISCSRFADYYCYTDINAVNFEDWESLSIYSSTIGLSDGKLVE